MPRMNKKLLGLISSALIVGTSSMAFAAANPFSDVPNNHWARDAVIMLAAEGINEGYGDGTFLGNRNITRYEVSMMLAKLLSYNFNVSQSKAETFSDVPKNHWAYHAVTLLSSTGIVSGYVDGTFRGEKNITRYEMTTMIAKLIANNTNVSGRIINPFSDIPNDHWAIDGVSVLATQGIIDGYKDGTFRGNRNVTRYEAAMMLAKTLASKL